MKTKSLKLILLSAILLPFAFSLSAKDQWSLNGVGYDVDTLVYEHKVGPGTTLAKYNVPDFPMLVSVIKMDLTNPYVTFETCKGGDRGVCEETPVSMYARNDSVGHEMIGATNGDFYFYRDVVENGIPRSGQFRRSEIVSSPVGRACFVLDEQNKPYIDQIDFTATVKFGDAVNRLGTVNMQRLEWESSEVNANRLNLYTNGYGPQTENCSGGTKVIITPVEGEFFWCSNQDIKAKVEQIIDGTGVTEIPKGKAILWGLGSSEAFLKTFSVGSEITINLTTNLRSQVGAIGRFKEMVGGSDHIVLQNGHTPYGIEASRHPRTCIGYTKDEKTLFLIVIDGRQPNSAGASLHECGEVFLALGAYNGINLDGGGSSIMIVNKEIMNSPSDGKPRPVGNGCLVYSKAPVDDNVAKIGFEPSSQNVLAYAKLTPKIYGYNTYGLLKTKDLEGVTFTCDPEIGKIVDGCFIASPTPAAGYLTAHYNGVEAKKKIVVIPTLESRLVLSQVVVDKLHDYSVEIIATNGVYSNLVDPLTLEWTVDDPTVCKVENGVVKYLKNGETTIHGKSGSMNVSMKIIAAQTDYAEKAIYSNDDIQTWKLTKSSVKDVNFTLDDKGFDIDFVASAGRSRYIKMAKDLEITGIPEYFNIKVDAGETPLMKATFAFKTPLINSKLYTVEYEAGKPLDLKLTPAEILGDDHVGNFQITLTSVHFTFNVLKSNQSYKLKVPSFSVSYAQPGSVEGVEFEKKEALQLYPNPVEAGQVVTLKNIKANGEFTAKIFDNAGAMVKSVVLDAVNGEVAVSTEGLVPGLYHMVAGEQKAKILVK